MIAELLELYPKDIHLYFLAIDAEHLYDVARLVTDGSQDQDRLHLLNVSRIGLRDPRLKSYLVDNGISEQTLSEGRKVVFVDLGYAGSISQAIASHFPREFQIF